MSQSTPETPKTSQSDLNSLAKPILDYLLEFQRIVVESGFNYPVPSWEFVRAVQRELEPFDDPLLANIRELDDRLGLKGRAFNRFSHLAESVKDFENAPDGPKLQSLLKVVLETKSYLENLVAGKRWWQFWK